MDFCGRIQICYFFCYDPCFVLWGMIVLVREHGIGVRHYVIEEDGKGGATMIQHGVHGG